MQGLLLACLPKEDEGRSTAPSNSSSSSSSSSMSRSKWAVSCAFVPLEIPRWDAPQIFGSSFSAILVSLSISALGLGFGCDTTRQQKRPAGFSESAVTHGNAPSASRGGSAVRDKGGPPSSLVGPASRMRARCIESETE